MILFNRIFQIRFYTSKLKTTVNRNGKHGHFLITITLTISFRIFHEPNLSLEFVSGIFISKLHGIILKKELVHIISSKIINLLNNYFIFGILEFYKTFLFSILK